MRAITSHSATRRPPLAALLVLVACLRLIHAQSAPTAAPTSMPANATYAYSMATAAPTSMPTTASSSSGAVDSGVAVGDDANGFAEKSDSVAVSGNGDGESGSEASTPIPTASVGSSTFALVDSVTCDDDTIESIQSLCSINRAMFDSCVASSGYQIFPYSGVVPTAEDITGLVETEACMGFITAVVLLNMPACTVSQMPLRAVCETLLKISVDMEEGAAAPSAEEFHEQMAWRRDSDLAKQAGQPYDNGSAIYAAFTRNLRVALSDSHVTVLSNMTIIIEDLEGEAIDMADGAEAAFDMSVDTDNEVGTVEAADDDGSADLSVVSEESDSDSSNTEVAALTSGASMARVATLVAVAAATTLALLA